LKRATGQERLDGFAVETYEGKFATKAFDVPDHIGQTLAYNDEVLIVMQARLKPPTFGEDSNGDLKRIHTFEVNEVEIITDAETWDKVEAVVGVIGVKGQLRLFNPLLGHDSLPEAFGVELPDDKYRIAVDEKTGEIGNFQTSPGNANEKTPEEIASEHDRARERAAESIGLDDDDSGPYVAGEDIPEDTYVPGVERVNSEPVNKDPILRKFLQETPSGG
jgi:hypothetical protein